MNHTPGPWTYDHEMRILTVSGADNFIASVYFQEDKFNDWQEQLEGCRTTEANARLIAEAPTLKAENERLEGINKELLEALKYVTFCLRTHSDRVPEDEQMWTSTDEEALEIGLEAIRKAKES